MGGGGGGGFIGRSPSKVAKDIRQAETTAQDASFSAEVNALLGELLAAANDRDTEGVVRHLEAIKQALDKEIEGAVDLLFGGSVAKHTYVDGISDVDTLVVVNESELANKTPEEVCQYFVQRLSERLPGTLIERDGFAVTVRYADSTIQLVPVLRRGATLLLPDAKCERWDRVRPTAFTTKLTDVNRACGGRVVPTIKLVKMLVRTLPQNRQLSSYHLEELAIRAFEGYGGARAPQAMLHHFFSVAPGLTAAPIPERTGQSRHVDDYLGPSGSLERLMARDALSRLGRRLRNADAAHALERWRRLFEAGGG